MPVNDPATAQALNHLANINGFLREIAAELKALNQRDAAREARARESEKRPESRPRTRG